MDIRMPDGTIIRNVPEGTTKADLQRRLERSTGGVKPSVTPPEGSNLSQGYRDELVAGMEPSAPAPQPPPAPAGVLQQAVPVSPPADSGAIPPAADEPAGIDPFTSPAILAKNAPKTTLGTLTKRSAARLAQVTAIPDLVIQDFIAGSTPPPPGIPAKLWSTVSERQREKMLEAVAVESPTQFRAYADKETARIQGTQKNLESYQGSEAHKALTAVPDKAREWEAQAVDALPAEWKRAVERNFVERDERGELQFGEGAADPKWYGVQAVDLAFMMAPGIGASGLAARASYSSAYAETLAKLSTQKIPQSVALTAARKAGEQAAKKAAIVAGGMSEGGVAGGMQMSQVQQTLSEVDEETFMQYEPYKRARAAGLSHEAAAGRIAVDKAVAAGLATASVTGLTGAPLNAFLGKWFTGGSFFGGDAATSVAGKVAARGKTALAAGGMEGGQETVQEGFDQLSANLAEGPITGVSPGAGVIEAGLTGGWLGFLMGGAGGAIAGPEGPAVKNKPVGDLDQLAGALAVARENYAALIKPGIRVTQDQIDDAKEAYEVALVALGKGVLKSGALPPEEQQKLAEALQQAPGDDADDGPGGGAVVGEVRAPGAPAPAAETAGEPQTPAAPKPAAKPAEPLSEVEVARQDALNRVASADTIEEAALTELVGQKLAKLNPQTGRPILLPAGKRQRAALNKRAEAAEEAEKEAAKPKPVAEKPQPKSPKKTATVAAAPQSAPAAEPKPKKPRAKKAKAAATLNIGHNVGGEVKLTPERVRAVLEKRGVQLVSEEVREAEGADDERTSVIQLDRALTPEEANEVSIELEQESIAQRVGDKGELYGPGADKWRPFDSARFKEPGKKAAVRKQAVSTEREPAAEMDETFDRDGPEGDFVPDQPIELEPGEDGDPGPVMAVDEVSAARAKGRRAKLLAATKIKRQRTADRIYEMTGRAPPKQSREDFQEEIQYAQEEIERIREGIDSDYFWMSDEDKQDAIDEAEGDIAYAEEELRKMPKAESVISPDAQDTDRIQLPALSPAQKELVGRKAAEQRAKRRAKFKVIDGGKKDDEPVMSVSAARDLRPQEPAPERPAAREKPADEAKRLLAEARALGDEAEVRAKVRSLPMGPERAKYMAAQRKYDRAKELRQEMAPVKTTRPDDGEPVMAVAGGENDPPGFQQDNPAVRGEESGRKWLAKERRKAEEAQELATRHGTTGGSNARGFTGSITAWVRDLDLPTDVVAELTGTNNEDRRPGDHQFDRLMENVRKKGFNQERSPILIMVNHGGEAYIHEGNTRAAVAKSIGAPTIRAEVRWYNGGEMVPGNWSPQAVKEMVDPEPVMAVAAELPAEGEPLLAPNGKPSKLTRAQWQQVRTPAFKRWFGDWEKYALQQGGVWTDTKKEVSKVVDKETGEPLVVYRGVGSAPEQTIGLTTGNYTDRAFFSANRRVSETYTLHRDEADVSPPTEPPEGYSVYKESDGTWTVMRDGDTLIDNGQESEASAIQSAWDDIGENPSLQQGGIYSVFLNIRDPHETNFEGAHWDGSRYEQYEVVKLDEDGDRDWDEERFYTDDGRGFFDEDEAIAHAARLGGNYSAERAPDEWYSTNNFADEAKRYGDGAIIREVVDDGAYGGDNGPSDVFVIFDAAQAKSATQNRGTFDPDDSRLAFAVAPLFYSAVRKAAADAKIEKGTGPQWYSTIKNTPGVKQEELDWIGLKDWLGDRKGVSKQEVWDYIFANELKVDEVVRGSTQHPMLPGVQRDTTKFNRPDLVTEGGQDYRELLITLPSTASEATVEERDGRWGVVTQQEGFIGFKSEAAARGAAAHLNVDRRNRGDFVSGHWDEENVLLHIRFNVRDDVGSGGRTLFIEEIQSDWHQKGRKLGYTKDTKGWTAHPLHTPESGFTNWRIDDADGNRVTNIVGGTAESAIREAGEGVPNAPFKTTWPELALKRAIRWAAENGFDQVAWTSGQMQNERYNLAKHVDTIVVWKSAAKGYDLTALRGGEWVFSRGGFTKADLVAHIGEDLTERALGRLNDETDAAMLDGLDLNVGGKGMTGFYDKMLPAAADKIGKKYGAIVKPQTFGNTAGFRVHDRGLYAQLRWDVVNAGGTSVITTPFEDRDDAEAAAEAHNAEDVSAKKHTAHVLPITDRLREAALGGFPMFAAGKGRGMPIPAVQAVLANAQAQAGVPVTVVATQDDLPGRTPQVAKSVGARVVGLFHNPTGLAYVVAGNVRNADHAVETYYHEVVGHKGLRALLGDDYAEVMDRIRQDFPEEVEKARVKNKLKGDTDRSKRLAAEESVAYAAGSLLLKTGGKDQRSIWRKMVDFVRAAIIKRGHLKMNKNDIDALIYRALGAARKMAAQAKYEAKIEAAAAKGTPLPKPDPINDGPLLGMPTKVTMPDGTEVAMGPFMPAREAARRYKKQAGINLPDIRIHARVNEATAKRVARAYQKMKHDPLDPKVKAAYEALTRETLAQYQAIKATGLKVEFIPKGQDPYAASPRMAIEDVKNNNHLWVFPTDTGFGMDAEAEYMKNNPLLALTDEYVGQHRLVVNDVFRIVHDYFGHIKEGNGFRYDGEENAWRIHSMMYSPLARAAMTSETRGQNSWLNWGPHGEKNRKAKSADTVYAEQKIGLLPAEFWNPEPNDEMAFAADDAIDQTETAAFKRWFGASKVVDADGKPLVVYHGTYAAFGAFSPKSRGRRYQNAVSRTGYFFTPDYGSAQGNFAFDHGGRVIQAYLSLQNPIEIDGRRYSGLTDAGANTLAYTIRQAVKDGHDGAIIRGWADGSGTDTQYVAFKPNQIKSTGNSGAFDPEDDRIAFAVADEVADTIHEIAGLLTPDERARLNRATAQKLVDLFDSLPDEKERGAVALAGAAARGWYRDSAETIADIFGPDAPRFAGLLAALSPQVSVQDNLKNAVAVWGNWVKAGRPVKKTEIKKIMASSLWGASNATGKKGVLPSWIPNTVRALTSDSPENLVLSGPKVSSFAANLRNEVNEVTLDSWMAAFDKLDAKKFFSGKISADKKDPGKRVGYKAVAARVRQTAQYLTKRTGEVWTPAEVQETIWSWTKTLTELAAKYGPLSSAEEIVKNGELTNELVNATVNFATLFALPEQQALLRNIGYGERLDRAAERAKARASARRKAPETTGADRQRTLTAARRLDSLRAERARMGVMGASRMEDVPFAVDDEQEAAFSFLSGNTGDRDIDEFMAGIGDQKRSIPQMWQDWTENLSARAQMAIFDDLYGIKRAGDIAGISAADVGFKNAHLAKSAAELTQALIEYGYPVWLKDGDHWVAGVEGGQGFIDILKPLKGNVNLWAAWMVANRADRLMGEGRERHFKKAGIDKVKMLHTQHPEFETVRDAYAAFQKKVLDFAQEAGIIDPQTRAVWEHADYIPFYRIIESGQIQGPNGGGTLGKVRNQIRKLKGGRANIGDPLENIARNWYSLMDASLKAHAARKVVDALDGSGLVTRAPQAEITSALVPRTEIEKFIKNNPALVQHLTNAGVDLARLPPAAFAGIQKMLAIQPPSGEDIISVWRNGKREYWHVHDDLLFESLMNVNKAAWGPLMELFRFPKRFGTAMITSTLAFGAKNFWRDMLHTFVQGSTDGKTTIIPGLDSVKGAISQFRKDADSQALLAGGGSFTHGYIRGGDTAGAAATVRRSLRKVTPSELILDSPAKVWRFYRDVLNAAENAHRVAIYKNVLKKGASRLDAMYEARDLLDFSKTGNNVAVQFLTQSVMFLNARAQGLYRLGRGMGAGKAWLSIAMRGSLYMMGVLLLYARQHDDERYKALTDADKSSYIHFFDVFAEGDHYRLPVPFEIGTIFGTVPLAITEAITSDEPDAGKQALHLIGHAFGETLNMKPDVQLIQPLIELGRNKDSFTEMPILTMGDEAVLPEEQDDPRVNPTVRALAQAMPDVAPEAIRSPKQLSHLVRNYTGAVMDYVFFASDAAVRRAMGEPPMPQRRLRDYPDIKAFVQTGPQRSTKYSNAMFEIAEEADKVAASIRRLEQAGTEKADARIEELETENQQLLDVREDFADAAQESVDLRKQMREIQLDPDMTPKEKQEEIDAITIELGEVAYGVWDLRPGGKLNPNVAAELIDKDVQGRIDTLRKNGFPATAGALGEL